MYLSVCIFTLGHRLKGYDVKHAGVATHFVTSEKVIIFCVSIRNRVVVLFNKVMILVLTSEINAVLVIACKITLITNLFGLWISMLCFILFISIWKLTELESSLLNLVDPHANSIQEVLNDYDKKVGILNIFHWYKL